MQKIKTIIILIALLGAMSFSGVPTSKVSILKTTTYGICGCDNSFESNIEMTLHPDQTFQYRNVSNPHQKVEVTGNWVMRGKKIVLQAEASEKDFNKTWKFDKGQSCILSRKGLTFIRLCDKESCK